jgi:hypothetical protein
VSATRTPNFKAHLEDDQNCNNGRKGRWVEKRAIQAQLIKWTKAALPSNVKSDMATCLARFRCLKITATIATIVSTIT